MTLSMTAFAREDASYSLGDLVWEVRSVNHKYLDVHLKLPDELRILESRCRDLINTKLNRGRIDALLKLDRKQSTGSNLNINQQALADLAAALTKIESSGMTLTPNKSIDLLRWPGVLEEDNFDLEALQQQAMDLLSEALQGLLENRQREGQRMAALIKERTSACRIIVATLRQALPEIQQAIQARWQTRLESLEQEIDDVRLNQELAIMLTKIDVSEELDRLESHFDEIESVINSNKPAGRRLDFLMQELNREANTLGSKSIDSQNTRASVELKVLIDQMREQIQNIE